MPSIVMKNTNTRVHTHTHLNPTHNKLRNLVKMVHSIDIFYLVQGLKITKINELLADLTHYLTLSILRSPYKIRKAKQFVP